MPISILSLHRKTLLQYGLPNTRIHYQLNPEELIDQTIERNEGVFNNTGALCINTGEFTGRCPQDKFIVKDGITENTICWNNFNLPIEETYFFQLRKKLFNYL